MPLKPKHRREIRDLLKILYDDRIWQPHHTDRLLSVVRAARSDVADEVEKSVAVDFATFKREQLALRKQQVDAVREVEDMRDRLKDHHAKIAALLETLIDLPIAKAMIVDEETGEVKVDHHLISDKDAKVALSAAEKVLKATGVFTPPKVDVEVRAGNAFELFDAVEVDEEDE